MENSYFQDNACAFLQIFTFHLLLRPSRQKKLRCPAIKKQNNATLNIFTSAYRRLSFFNASCAGATPCSAALVNQYTALVKSLVTP